MPKVFISLLTYNNNSATLECLESLEKLVVENYQLHVIIIDNASKEKFQLLKYKNFKYNLIRNENNMGFSGGQNVGIKYALANGADYVVLLNNDTIADKNLILEMLKTFKDNIGIVAPKIYFAKGFEFHKDRYKDSEKGRIIWFAGGVFDWKNVYGIHRGVDEVDNGQFEKIMEIDYATGCCMMVKKEVFEKVGLLDNKFFLYFEDADFSIRSKKMGFEIVFSPKAILWHKNAASTGGSGSSLQDYFISRNRMILGLRYASIRTKGALVKESLKLIKSGREGQRQGLKDFYLGKLGKGSLIK